MRKQFTSGRIRSLLYYLTFALPLAIFFRSAIGYPFPNTEATRKQPHHPCICVCECKGCRKPLHRI